MQIKREKKATKLTQVENNAIGRGHSSNAKHAKDHAIELTHFSLSASESASISWEFRIPPDVVTRKMQGRSCEIAKRRFVANMSNVELIVENHESIRSSVRPSAGT